MGISIGDLEFRYSNPMASAGNQLAQGDPNASLGGWLSATVWAGGVLNDLFADISSDVNLLQSPDYRCLFVVNKNSGLTWLSPVLWIVSQTIGGADVSVGVDIAPATPVNYGIAMQATYIVNDQQIPSGVVFSQPTSKAVGLALGDMPPGYCKAVWLRRLPLNAGSLAGDSATIRVEGDSL